MDLDKDMNGNLVAADPNGKAIYPQLGARAIDGYRNKDDRLCPALCAIQRPNNPKYDRTQITSRRPVQTNTLNNPLNATPIKLGMNTIVVTHPDGGNATVKFMVSGKMEPSTGNTTALGAAITSISVDYSTSNSTDKILESEFM